MKILLITGGVIAICLGILILSYCIKHPIEKVEDTNKHNLQGIVGSILLIAFGATLIIREITNIE